jgi:hypothetical protein
MPPPSLEITSTSQLSPFTVAKLIVMGVTMVGMWIESWDTKFLSGPDFPASVIDWALDGAWMNVPKEANFSLHFKMLMTCLGLYAVIFSQASST